MIFHVNCVYFVMLFITHIETENVLFYILFQLYDTDWCQDRKWFGYIYYIGTYLSCDFQCAKFKYLIL